MEKLPPINYPNLKQDPIPVVQTVKPNNRNPPELTTPNQTNHDKVSQTDSLLFRNFYEAGQSFNESEMVKTLESVGFKVNKVVFLTEGGNSFGFGEGLRLELPNGGSIYMTIGHVAIENMQALVDLDPGFHAVPSRLSKAYLVDGRKKNTFRNFTEESTVNNPRTIEIQPTNLAWIQMYKGLTSELCLVGSPNDIAQATDLLLKLNPLSEYEIRLAVLGRNPVLGTEKLEKMILWINRVSETVLKKQAILPNLVTSATSSTSYSKSAFPIDFNITGTSNILNRPGASQVFSGGLFGLPSGAIKYEGESTPKSILPGSMINGSSGAIGFKSLRDKKGNVYTVFSAFEGTFLPPYTMEDIKIIQPVIEQLAIQYPNSNAEELSLKFIEYIKISHGIPSAKYYTSEWLQGLNQFAKEKIDNSKN